MALLYSGIYQEEPFLLPLLAKGEGQERRQNSGEPKKVETLKRKDQTPASSPRNQGFIQMRFPCGD